MKISFKIIRNFITIFFVFFLVSCSTSDDKDAESEAQLSEAAKAKQEAEAKPAPPPEPKKEEPVVEVMPSKGAGADLTVEPIPEKKPEPKEESPQITEPEPSEQAAVEPEPEMAVVEEPKAPKIEVPKSTGPNHFVVTAATKDEAHPFFGKGHPMGFLINDVPGKEIVLERGKTYKFDVATDPKHDVYFSTKDVGWGSTPYSKGIEGMYTYKGTMTVKPTNETPGVLYYSCRNHPFMGGKVHIINPGEKVKLAKQAVAKRKAKKSEAKPKQATEAQAKQKIMFAEMLAASKNTKAAAKNVNAASTHKKATDSLAQAKDKLKAGDFGAAFTLADSAVAHFKKSSKMVPSKAAQEQQKLQYKELQVSVKDFEASHKDSYDRMVKKQGAEKAVDYDKAKVKKLKDNAGKMAAKGNYAKANESLSEAQRIVTGAIQKMLNAQTIVYDLKFESAEEEYEYEERRFVSYAELIPIAIEQKKPTEQVVKLMDSFVKKGESLRDRAKQKAKEGDFPTAIAMLQDATKDVRRALRMAGVMQ